MNKNNRMVNFGTVVAVLLSGVNVLHLLWTVWLTVEQIETGFGYGTDMEMLALLPWMTELLCSPVLIVGMVYLVLSIFYRHRKGLVMINTALFAAAVIQYALVNLFIWY